LKCLDDERGVWGLTGNIMFRISDIRIGVKLAIVSGLDVVLVAGMLFASPYSYGQIKAANDAALLQQNIVHDLDRLEIAFINTRLTLRNVRLAMTEEEPEAANRALTQMDEVTQQNSALVEENAATAKTLEHQANAMKERIAVFRVDDAEIALSADGEYRPVGGMTVAAAAMPNRAAAAAPKRAVSAGGGAVRVQEF
jgi:hypothetical protein